MQQLFDKLEKDNGALRIRAEVAEVNYKLVKWIVFLQNLFGSGLFVQCRCSKIADIKSFCRIKAAKGY